MVNIISVSTSFSTQNIHNTGRERAWCRPWLDWGWGLYWLLGTDGEYAPSTALYYTHVSLFRTLSLLFVVLLITTHKIKDLYYITVSRLDIILAFLWSMTTVFFLPVFNNLISSLDFSFWRDLQPSTWLDQLSPLMYLQSRSGVSGCVRSYCFYVSAHNGKYLTI